MIRDSDLSIVTRKSMRSNSFLILNDGFVSRSNYGLYRSHFSILRCTLRMYFESEMALRQHDCVSSNVSSHYPIQSVVVHPSLVLKQ